jgi:pilus assembly protein CpaD
MTRQDGAAARSRNLGTQLLRAAALAGCAALLSGCMAKTRPELSVAAPNDYRLRHPITVKEQDRTVELFIGERRGELNPSQRADVLAFAQSWKREATGGIVVEVPSASPNASAATGALKEVGSIFAAAGIPAHSVALRSYRPRSPRRLATVRLNYPVMAAEVGPCGLWPEDIGPTTKSYRLNKSYWNFGCASQRNLAAMVANPTDLVQPRAEGEIYRQRRTYVLEAYRRGAQTGSTAPANDAAKISDVGK